MRRRKKEKSSKLIILLVVAAVVVLAAAAALLSLIREVEVTLNGDQVMEISWGSEFSDPGATAVWRSKFFHFLNGEVEVEATGEVDTSSLGTYEILYSAAKGNLADSKIREVDVIDDEAPVITLDHIDGSYTLPGHPYEEEGFTATDNVDGDITSHVSSKEKDGVVTYTVSDSSGNETSVTREINYDDREAPVIEFSGDDSLLVGKEWNGSFTATDNADGDITDRVVVTGSVDTQAAGTYELVYTVSDSWGNMTEKSRSVTVFDKAGGNQITGEPVSGSKIVFLTFDDGPGAYTEELLDILAEYNVKVTFFVTNQFPAYQDLIAREAEEGHTVAVHSYSHEWDIYSSESAYWEDFNAMNDIIEEQTGSRSDLFRFPGGSSNVISASYCVGIMSALTESAEEMGLEYYDWNVTSGDAGDTEDPDQVVQNVIDGIESVDISVVLMHDIHRWSVDAVESILSYGLSNGFTFMPMYKGCFTCHHGVYN